MNICEFDKSVSLACNFFFLFLFIYFFFTSKAISVSTRPGLLLCMNDPCSPVMRAVTDTTLQFVSLVVIKDV